MGLRLKIIINPSSGRETAMADLDSILMYLSDAGSLTRADINYTAGRYDAVHYAEQTRKDEYDAVIAMGGDGTVNEVITGMMRGGIDIPLAIFTSGTVNDFATINGLPQNASDFARMLIKPRYIRIDCGKANEDYFLNVAAGGLMTDVAYRVSSDAKTAIGPAAYFLSAMKDIPSISRSIPVKITANGKTFEEEIIMFMISNTRSVGGFRGLMTMADITDGVLDFLAVKKMDPVNVVPLLGSLVIGDHLRNENIIYFQSDDIMIESDSPVDLDIDGEKGSALPARITCIKKAITLIVPNKEEPL